MAGLIRQIVFLPLIENVLFPERHSDKQRNNSRLLSDVLDRDEICRTKQPASSLRFTWRFRCMSLQIARNVQNPQIGAAIYLIQKIDIGPLLVVGQNSNIRLITNVHNH